MLNNLFVSDAFAQASEIADPNKFSFSSIVPIIAIFGVFYFLIVRPQSKKHKLHQEMVKGLKIGNKVITSSGIVGVVKNILEEEEQLEVEIAENVRVKILRHHVSELVVKDKDAKAKK